MSYVITESGKEAWEVDKKRLEENLRQHGVKTLPYVSETEKALYDLWGYTSFQWQLRKLFSTMLYDCLESYYFGNEVQVSGKPLKELMNEHVKVAQKCLEEMVSLTDTEDLWDRIQIGEVQCEDRQDDDWTTPYSKMEALIRHLC